MRPKLSAIVCLLALSLVQLAAGLQMTFGDAKSLDRTGSNGGSPKQSSPKREPNGGGILKECSRFGLPSQDNIRVFDNFIVSYDRRLREPVWVMEHLTAKRTGGRISANRANSQFQEDETLHPYFRATSDDYRGSGFDRGHMVPAGDQRHDQRAMDETFKMSNVVPQLPGVNKGAWLRLERYVNHLGRRSKNMYVVSGPLFMPQAQRDGMYVNYKVIGKNRIAVPSHFYKVWLREDNDAKLSMEAFLVPNSSQVNEDTELIKFRLPIDQLETIERAAGLVFFDQVNRRTVAKPTTFQLGHVDRKITFDND